MILEQNSGILAKFYKPCLCNNVLLKLVVGSGEHDKRTLKSVLYDFVDHDYVFFR